ncbi:hypothetical protein MP638_001872 [Amoeboaphelidium occidentale]|nr:hypothetical protein MP638_001872 [Amoeboaphelidium occidentale]
MFQLFRRVQGGLPKGFSGVYRAYNARFMSITASVGPKSVLIGFADNHKSSFGHFWLRDHCKCPECWHPETKQRLFDTFSVPMNISPRSAEVSDNMLHVTWPDNHKSVYDLDWLKRHSYDPKLPSKSVIASRKKILWDKNISSREDYPRVLYQDVMRGNVGLAKWLELIDKFGFCEDFTSNLAHGDTAYTNLGIGAHTDTTYFTDPIGLQLFHLLEHQGEGGHTLLVDGFFVAQKLKEQYPEYYDVLTRINVPTHSAGDKEILIHPTPKSGFPIIRVSPKTNEVYQIRYNNHDRSVLSGKQFSPKDIDHFYLSPKTNEVYQIRYNNHDRSVLSGQQFSPKDIDHFYRALKAWKDIVTDKQVEFWTKMKPGTAVIVDNWRVLHGRSSFTGKRRLCGAYLNWDDYRSRINTVLDKKKMKDDL